MSEKPQLRWKKRDDIALGSDRMQNPEAHRAMNDDFSSGGKHDREAQAEEAAHRGAHVDAERKLLDGVDMREFERRRRMMQAGFSTGEILDYVEEEKQRTGTRYGELGTDDFVRLRNRETR